MDYRRRTLDPVRRCLPWATTWASRLGHCADMNGAPLTLFLAARANPVAVIIVVARRLATRPARARYLTNLPRSVRSLPPRAARCPARAAAAAATGVAAAAVAREATGVGIRIDAEAAAAAVTGEDGVAAEAAALVGDGGAGAAAVSSGGAGAAAGSEWPCPHAAAPGRLR